MHAFIALVYPRYEESERYDEVGSRAVDTLESLLQINDFSFYTIADEELKGLEILFGHYDAVTGVLVLGVFIGADDESSFFRLFGLTQEQINECDESELGYIVLHISDDTGIKAAAVMATGEDSHTLDAYTTPEGKRNKIIAAAQQYLA
jgi:hypothetical protein